MTKMGFIKNLHFASLCMRISAVDMEEAGGISSFLSHQTESPVPQHTLGSVGTSEGAAGSGLPGVWESQWCPLAPSDLVGETWCIISNASEGR